jgi:Icc-related predicted phosphoesterase
LYKTKINDQGQIELWWKGETTLSLLGVYESQEELDKAREQVNKQEERNQFLSHTLKNGKRRKVVLREEESAKKKTSLKTVVISDDITQVGNLDLQQIDLLISLGDLMDQMVFKAIEVYQPLNVLAVRGNHDDDQPFQKPIQDLHLQVTEINGWLFSGFNGSWKYKEQGPYLYTQEQASRLLNRYPSVDIFISHNSPLGVHERDNHTHQGFNILMEYIERVQPRYFFHGHQHINQTTMVGETAVIGIYGESEYTIEL